MIEALGKETALVSFRYKGIRFGVPLEAVERVAGFSGRAGGGQAGSGAWEEVEVLGQVVPAVDLRASWDVAVEAEPVCGLMIVLRTTRGRLALLVGGVDGFPRLRDFDLAQPPEAAPGKGPSPVRGIYVGGAGDPLVVLDTERIAGLLEHLETLL